MKKLSIVALLLLLTLTSAYSKEKTLTLNAAVTQMKSELQLNDEQAKAIKPILNKYAQIRQNYIQSMQDALTVNKKQMGIDLKKIRKEENEELSKVLSEEQMQKRINKQNLKDSLNRGDIDFDNQSEEVAITPQGGSMQF